MASAWKEFNYFKVKNQCDVAIIGGGPAGSTVAGFLKKFKPDLDVVIFEREIFPRDHVGESLLPRVTQLLADLGCWDQMEAAGFPVKVGAKYRWGDTENLWNFDFIPGGKFEDAPRPGKFEGQRVQTAFQVDRSIYDKILLDYAKSLGTRVYEDVKVTKVHVDGDRITGLTVAPEGELGEKEIAKDSEFTARYYIDASGNSGFLRRSLDIPVDSPTHLRNIAVWDYWQNAEWMEHIGVGGTRIRVLSLKWGWIWFIPIGPTRTSIGLVLPAAYLKSSGKRPEQLYVEALESEPEVKRLLANATRENILKATKDWNFISDRLVGENWFLAGDSGGFADPIMSAGLTLAQTGAMRIANTILEIDKGELDADWLRKDFCESQRAQIRNHMAFADYWYSANGCFSDLKEYCSEIAANNGLVLDAENAFWWLGTGGFAHDALGAASTAFTRVSAIRHTINHMSGEASGWEIEKSNVFRLNTDDTTEVFVGNHIPGGIRKVRCLKRGARLLPLYLVYGAMHDALKLETEIQPLLERFIFELKKSPLKVPDDSALWHGIETLEAMIGEGWVETSVDSSKAKIMIVSGPVRPYVGWWTEGVGMTGIIGSQIGKVVLTIDEIEKVRAGMGDEELHAARQASAESR